MKMKMYIKRFIAFVLILILAAAAFTGCAVKDKAKGAAEGSETTNAEIFPLTVTDANGFEMTIDKRPEAIISLTLGTDEMLLEMVDTSRLKALTPYSDDPGISNVTEKAALVTEKIVSETETVISLQPDLVFTDTWSNPDFVQQVRDAGIAVYVFKTPDNIEEQRNAVLEIAHVVGEDEKGEEIVAWMDEKLEEVEEKLKDLTDDKKLTVIDYGEMGSSGKGTNFDDIVTRAGLINLVSREGLEGWPLVSKEKIIEWNPDIIIIPSWYYDKNNSLESFKAGIKNDTSLSDVNAVKNDRLIAVSNPHISAISQYVVLGVEDVARAAYPHLFE